MKSAPVFYDCEAAGLDGHIIEVGWAFYDQAQDKIISAGYLIKPEPEWNIEESWDAEAQKLHGISFGHLKQHGLPAWKVAQIMNKELEGRELFSDSPKDEVWVAQLFDAAGLEPAFTIRRMDADLLLRKLIAEKGRNLDDYEKVKASAQQNMLHRAEADALIWGGLWKEFSA